MKAQTPNGGLLIVAERVCDEMDAPVKSASQCAKLIEQQTRFS
jgi:hypothetical protein